MKSLFYAVFLLAVLVASVLLLHSIQPSESEKPPAGLERPVVGGSAASVSGIVRHELENATTDEIYAIGMELFNLWHVREATSVFEQAVVADSAYYRAWVRLVECYSHPLVSREDEAREAWTNAWETRLSAADTVYLTGLKKLFIERDHNVAVDRLSRAEKTEVSHEDASYYLTLSLLKVGNTVEARRKLEDLLSRDDTVGRVMELSIRCALAAGDYETAEEQARDLARMYSEEPRPYVLLAQVALTRGKVGEAIEFCNNALVLDPKYIPAIVTRANLYAAQFQIEPARVSFEKLLLFDDPVLRAIGMEGISFVDMLSGRFDDGVAAMDEAIRFAMLAGSVRRGLFYTYRLVEYLCELGQGDAAEAVVNRWITGFGDIPVNLGKLRIHIFKGNLDQANRLLQSADSNQDWVTWIGVFSIDLAEMKALIHIGAEAPDTALEILARNTAVGPVNSSTQTFLRGYAEFESGDAEAASLHFEDVKNHLFGVEFPYHGNPVLYVQSLFYLAETHIASGRESEANTHYDSFMKYWGEADWDIQAINRAREKLRNNVGTEPAE